MPAYEPWRPTLFGGQVSAQSLRAAAATVDDSLLPQSIHAAYVAAGDPALPLELHVARTRDGRSFASRRVEARQGGTVILSLLASFHRREPGGLYAQPRPAGPDPDQLTDVAGFSVGVDGVHVRVRRIGSHAAVGLGSVASMWARVEEPWPAGDAALTACVLTWLADMQTGRAVDHALPDVDVGMMTSLDHALWFHADADPGDWFLLDLHPVGASRGRALVLGTVHDRMGTHVASFTQELLVRPVRPDVPPKLLRHADGRRPGD